MHPVGEIFIQYPSIGSFTTKTPMQLYNTNGITSTWVELNFDGAFFRANGGLSKTFGGGKQAEGIPEIVGAINIADQYIRGASGAFSNQVQEISYSSQAPSGTVNKVVNMSFFASKGERNSSGALVNNVYGKSDHVTPTNYTIKVWLRTA